MRHKNKAFTLIELLTVVAIIAMLIAMFGVGLQKVKIVQKNLQQKAAFHGAEVGLELFSKDFGEYPDSDLLMGAGGSICGAHRFAEAMLGRDERGFHPKSKWHPDDDMAAAPPHPGPNLYTELTEKDRKPEYLELKRSGIHTIYELWGTNKGAVSNIYDSGPSPAPATARAPVITDVFNRNRSDVIDEKAGMPVLYFKADPTKDFRVISYGDNTGRQGGKKIPIKNPNSQIYSRWIYDYGDNLPVLQLPWLREPTADMDTPEVVSPHYLEDPDDSSTQAVEVFYRILTQREDAATGFFKPYNPNTYILISAGYDGIYGTKDDVTNFNY